MHVFASVGYSEAPERGQSIPMHIAQPSGSQALRAPSMSEIACRQAAALSCQSSQPGATPIASAHHCCTSGAVHAYRTWLSVILRFGGSFPIAARSTVLWLLMVANTSLYPWTSPCSRYFMPWTRACLDDGSNREDPTRSLCARLTSHAEALHQIA